MNKKIVFSLVLLSAFSHAENLVIGNEQVTKGFEDGEAYINRCFFNIKPSTNWEWNDKSNYDVCTRLVKYNDEINVHCIDATYSTSNVGTTFMPIPSMIGWYSANNWKWFVDGDTTYVRNFNRTNWVYMNEGKHKLVKLLDYGNLSLDEIQVAFKNLYQGNSIYPYQDPSVVLSVGTEGTYNIIYFKGENGYWQQSNNPQYFKKPQSLFSHYIDDGKKNTKSKNFYARMHYNFSKTTKSNNGRDVYAPIIQEVFQEYSTNTTGRIKLDVNVIKENNNNWHSRGVLVYLTEQLNLNEAWKYDSKENKIFNFGDYFIGNRFYTGNYNVNYDTHNVIYYPLKSGNTFQTMLPNKAYNNFLSAMKDGDGNYKNEKIKRYSEQLLLKNTRVSPKVGNNNWNQPEYEREYQDKYYGGLTKCYTFDIKALTSPILRIGYFKFNNELLKNPNVSYIDSVTSGLGHFYYSIHKTNGDRAGIYEEGKTIVYSINARPSKTPTGGMSGDNNTAGHVDVGFTYDFYPDANIVFMTDMANQSSRNTEMELRVKDLNQVYIALQNNLISQDGKAKDIPIRPDGTKYYLTNFIMTKQQIANKDGELKNQQTTTIQGQRVELEQVPGINALGLRFVKDKNGHNPFYNLLGIAQDEIDNGNVYKITFKAYNINDVYGGYERPLFQVSGADIIKGNEPLGFTIILGKGQMPKVNFGTAYNSHEVNGKIVDGKVLDTTDIADKIYTRTNNQEIYLGFSPEKSYSLYQQYVRFFDKDKNELKNIEVYSKSGKIGISSNGCKGYYPISDKMVVKLKDKLKVGQGYKFSYEVAEYDNYNNICDTLGEKSSNEFTIRPDEIKYEVSGSKSFDKNAGKTDSKFVDNNVIFTSNIKDDKFGIGIAELRVSNTSGIVKTFNLEDKNANLLNKVEATTSFVDFDKTKGDFAIKTIFPMVTDAKILLSEYKFSHEDLKEGLCNNTNKALYKDDANKIELDGKINCQTPGNEISVNFIANQALDLEKNNVNRDISPFVKNPHFINYVPFSDSDTERLIVPLQISNINDGNYFYKKFDNDNAKVNFEIVYKVKPQDESKMILSANSDTLKVTANSAKGEFNIAGLNDPFDAKLDALDTSKKLSEYNEADFNARDFAKIGFSIGYPKTKADGSPRLEREFIITDVKSVVDFAKGLKANKDKVLLNEYTFAYTGLFFKDISVNNASVKNYVISSANAGLLKYVENKGFEKIESKFINDFNGLYNNAINAFNLISDYSHASLKKNEYVIPSKLEDNQYVKDTIRFDIRDSAYKYLDSFSTFTIEFVK